MFEHTRPIVRATFIRKDCLFLIVIVLLTTGCPQIERAATSTANVGDVIDLRDPDDHSLGWQGTVYFGSIPAPDVLSWSSTDVFVRVPEGLSGLVKVRVEVNKVGSNTVDLTVADEPIFLRLLCFGDSNTYQRYPEILQSFDWGAYEPVMVINQGKNAETIAYAANRFQDAVAFHNDNEDLDFVLLMEGTNDVFDDYGMSLADMQDALVTMIEIIPVDVQAVLATLVPRLGSCGDEVSPTVEEWNAWVRTFSIELDIPLVDVYTDIVSTPDWETVYYSGDCLHPNENGYTRMAELFKEKIHELLTD